MMNDLPRNPYSLILASASPRRLALLEQMGISCMVDSAEVCEACDGAPDRRVGILAQRKTQAVAERHPNAYVLGADTLVYCGQVLGKPQDPQEAKAMLELLSGKWHEVHTGVCLIHTATGKCAVQHAITRVLFVPLDGRTIDAYVATGDPLDKAGAYGIQGQAGMFVERIEGCYTNVVGLPITLVRQMLRSFGWVI